MPKGQNSQSLEKYAWILEQLSKYEGFKFTKFLSLFYTPTAKSRDAKDNFIDKIIANPALGLTNLKEPQNSDGSFDRDGYYTIDTVNIPSNPNSNPCFFPDKLIAALKENNVLFPAKKDSKADHSVTYLFSESDQEIVSYNLRVIISAIEKSQSLKFNYKDANRTVNPLRLICYQGKWYLLALENSEFRKYRLCRIKDIKLDKKFKLGLDYKQIDEFINGSFGIGGGKTKEIATIRFCDPASDWITEDHWHTDQILGTKNNSDNTIIMTVPYNPEFDDELLGRVMRYSGLAEILTPESLRSKWLNRIEEMHKKFIVKENI